MKWLRGTRREINQQIHVFCKSLVTIQFASTKAIWPSTVLTPTKRKDYLTSKVKYYSNSTASFNLTRLAICADVNSNPGPSVKTKFTTYERTVATIHRTVQWMSNMQISLPTHQVCWRVWTCTKCLLEVLPTDLSLNPTIDVSHERNDSIHSASSEKHPLCIMSNMRQIHRNHGLLVHLNINSIQNKFDELKESNKKLKVILSSRLIII